MIKKSINLNIRHSATIQKAVNNSKDSDTIQKAVNNSKDSDTIQKAINSVLTQKAKSIKPKIVQLAITGGRYKKRSRFQLVYK